MPADPPPEVLAAARDVVDRHAPYRVDHPVEYVLAPLWRIEAALDRLGRHGEDPSATYLVKLTGKFTSRVQPPAPSAPEIVGVVSEIFVLVEGPGPEAGRVRGSQSGGWPVDMAALGDVDSFDL